MNRKAIPALVVVAPSRLPNWGRNPMDFAASQPAEVPSAEIVPDHRLPLPYKFFIMSALAMTFAWIGFLGYLAYLFVNWTFA